MCRRLSEKDDSNMAVYVNNYVRAVRSNPSDVSLRMGQLIITTDED